MEDAKDLDVTPAAVEETPSGSKDLSKTLPEEAFNNFLQGKRHIVVQDYKFAVQSLATACEMYVKHFGEVALECGEVYYLYGKALFRLSQQQAGVLGGALNDEGTEDEEQGKSSEEDNKENESEKNDSDTENGDENAEDENDEENAEDENSEENAEDENSEENAEDENSEENQDEEMPEEKEPSESTDSPQAAAADETSKESNEKEAEPSDANDADKSMALDESKLEEETPKQEEDDDLELAWNNLEAAKSIFLKQGEKDVESQLKVAEILQLLAEISMESDNNTAAITDLKECLIIQRRHLKPDDRFLAETFYQMGLAQMLDKKYDEALENFSTTMSILQLKIDNLKATPVADTVGNFESADREKEIDDLESVLADIREKVEDTKELIKDAEKVIKETIGMKMKEAEEIGFAAQEKPETSDKPVTNINHLLKRKKPDQDEEDSKSKRLKLAPGVQTNGVS